MRPDQEYGDEFDLMSFNAVTFDFPAVVEGAIWIGAHRPKPCP